MPPRQNYQPPGQPVPPQQPQRSFTPQAPHYAFGTPAEQHFHQHPSGHYEVVPSLPAAQNNDQSGHNPYEFIINPNSAPAKGGRLLGDKFIRNVVLAVAGLAVLVIGAAVAISALTPKGSVQGMTSIAERQQELIRVSTAAMQQASSSDTKNFVTNLELDITSDQQQIVGYLGTHGTKLNSTELGLDQSAQTDTQLADAATANNYDSAVTQNLTGQLQTYETLLQTTYNQTSSTDAKKLLKTTFNNSDLLLKQAQALGQELGS
ncbi:MAG TPA: hypothetical protein VGM08_03980 [Candidatus Saccharimonadales bacterium]|jgi:hypothetical protein